MPVVECGGWGVVWHDPLGGVHWDPHWTVAAAVPGVWSGGRDCHEMLERGRHCQLYREASQRWSTSTRATNPLVLAFSSSTKYLRLPNSCFMISDHWTNWAVQTFHNRDINMTFFKSSKPWNDEINQRGVWEEYEEICVIRTVCCADYEASHYRTVAGEANQVGKANSLLWEVIWKKNISNPASHLKPI